MLEPGTPGAGEITDDAALAESIATIAACLGATPARVLFRVKLPLLLRPLLAAVMPSRR